MIEARRVRVHREVLHDDVTKADLTVEAYAWIHEGVLAGVIAEVRVGPGVGPHAFSADSIDDLRLVFDRLWGEMCDVNVADHIADGEQIALGL